MKKLLSVLLVLILSVFLLVGCSTKDPDTGKDGDGDNKEPEVVYVTLGDVKKEVEEGAKLSYSISGQGSLEIKGKELSYDWDDVNNEVVSSLVDVDCKYEATLTGLVRYVKETKNADAALTVNFKIDENGEKQEATLDLYAVLEAAVLYLRATADEETHVMSVAVEDLLTEVFGEDNTVDKDTIKEYFDKLKDYNIKVAEVEALLKTLYTEEKKVENDVPTTTYTITKETIYTFVAAVYEYVNTHLADLIGFVYDNFKDELDIGDTTKEDLITDVRTELEAVNVTELLDDAFEALTLEYITLKLTEKEYELSVKGSFVDANSYTDEAGETVDLSKTYTLTAKLVVKKVDFTDIPKVNPTDYVETPEEE